MKYKNIYFLILLVITSIILSWALPALVKVATTTPQDYPFIYYSSILQDFAIREKNDGKPVFQDAKGNQYTKNQFDSITPLLSFRQLMLSGTMPDTIMDTALDPAVLKVKSVYWRYSPREVNKPEIGLYSMFESMSGRANLESPDDVFRLKDNIEFITIRENKINKEKSQRFQKAMEEKGFVFPAKKVWGNLSPKKPYDEGYFVLDNNGQLFHLKMVNGKPYVSDTKAGENMNITYFSILEVADKSIYGFIINNVGEIFTLNTEGYSLTKFDIPNIDINQHSVLMMGNMFYWMVYVTTLENCNYNVLEAKSLKKHSDPYVVNAKTNRWDEVSAWLFPSIISLSDKNTEYIKPAYILNFGKAFIISIIVALLYTFTLNRKQKTFKKISKGLIIIMFGIPGLIASLLIK